MRNNIVRFILLDADTILQTLNSIKRVLKTQKYNLLNIITIIYNLLIVGGEYTLRNLYSVTLLIIKIISFHRTLMSLFLIGMDTIHTDINNMIIAIMVSNVDYGERTFLNNKFTVYPYVVYAVSNKNINVLDHLPSDSYLQINRIINSKKSILHTDISIIMKLMSMGKFIIRSFQFLEDNYTKLYDVIDDDTLSLYILRNSRMYGVPYDLFCKFFKSYPHIAILLAINNRSPRSADIALLNMSSELYDSTQKKVMLYVEYCYNPATTTGIVALYIDCMSPQQFVNLYIHRYDSSTIMNIVIRFGDNLLHNDNGLFKINYLERKAKLSEIVRILKEGEEID